MMSKEFLKKAGILGVSFGLMASPLAFAQTSSVQEGTSIEENQDDYVDQEPVEPQSEHTPDPAQYDVEDLEYNEGDQVNVTEPHSHGEQNHTATNSDDATFDGPEEVVERNHD